MRTCADGTTTGGDVQGAFGPHKGLLARAAAHETRDRDKKAASRRRAHHKRQRQHVATHAKFLLRPEHAVAPVRQSGVGKPGKLRVTPAAAEHAAARAGGMPACREFKPGAARLRCAPNDRLPRRPGSNGRQAVRPGGPVGGGSGVDGRAHPQAPKPQREVHEALRGLRQRQRGQGVLRQQGR